MSSSPGILVSIGVIVLSSAALFALVARPPAGLALATVAVAGIFLWLNGFALGSSWWQSAASRLSSAWPLDLWETFGDIGLLCLGASIGAGVAMMIRDRNILLPAAVFAAFADFFMVKYGTVHHALQSLGRQESDQRDVGARARRPPLPAGRDDGPG